MQLIVCGLIGPKCTSNARTTWNANFAERKIDAFFDFYRTIGKEQLELRLSEMFLLERRGYVIAPELQQDAVKLMDRLDESAEKNGKVDTVLNERGVLVGYAFEGRDDKDEARMSLWFP